MDLRVQGLGIHRGSFQISYSLIGVGMKNVPIEESIGVENLYHFEKNSLYTVSMAITIATLTPISFEILL